MGTWGGVVLAESAVGATGVACVGTGVGAGAGADAGVWAGSEGVGAGLVGSDGGVPGGFWVGVDGLAEARAGIVAEAVWVALPTALPGVAATC